MGGLALSFLEILTTQGPKATQYVDSMRCTYYWKKFQQGILRIICPSVWFQSTDGYRANFHWCCKLGGGFKKKISFFEKIFF